MTEPLPTSAKAQRERLFAYLLAHHQINTADCRSKLDILHPPARVLELRRQGHRIYTHWETIDTGKAKHRIGRYVLFSEGGE
ncbi:MAG: hypothetical protein FJ190_06590 [Gammaproteobacteria bacterium]|nr:hypothetical protein [Gammaproteobacteria bacterium]